MSGIEMLSFSCSFLKTIEEAAREAKEEILEATKDENGFASTMSVVGIERFAAKLATKRAELENMLEAAKASQAALKDLVSGG